MEIIVAVIVGVVVAALGGAAVAWVAGRARQADRHAVEEALRQALDEQRRLAGEERNAAVDALVTTGKAVIDAERELVGKDLEGTRSVIGEQVHAMHAELARMNDLVHDLERERAAGLGNLHGVLQAQQAQVELLAETTQGLRQALSSTKARGQWGERMAEDVLRLHGFVEGVNYRRQRAIESGIPDFTFMLPDGLALYMDVKFPLDNYLRYIESDTDIERQRARDDFLRDVRNHVKTLAARGYGSDDVESVDCVLLFIPNEALYAFIHETDRTILDDALAEKLVFCSPVTLYAVLAVVRQAVDNFRVESTSHEILARLAAFGKQWGAFVERMDKLGRSLDTSRKDFDELTGTRRRTLDRELDRIEDLRRHTNMIERAHADEDDPPPALALHA